MLSYEAGIALAIAIQDGLRNGAFDGWRVRFLIQPDSDELVLDYVTWLVIDTVRIVEYLGGRHVELFKDVSSLQSSYWLTGSAA